MFEKQCKAGGDKLKVPSTSEDPSAQTSELMDQVEKTETNTNKEKRTEESPLQMDGKQKMPPTKQPDGLKLNTEGESISPPSKRAKTHDAETSSAKWALHWLALYMDLVRPFHLCNGKSLIWADEGSEEI